MCGPSGGCWGQGTGATSQAGTEIAKSPARLFRQLSGVARRS
jgi:hypothetical protein